ncbi:MAG: BTAD domain-containing putative transcriptional regulator [Gemmatimonadota bacterium]
MTYRLNVLGTLDLRDANGAPVNSILQQPRRLALLVYLALADRDGMVKRDTLLGIFWPELTQENGRRALSQAIHFLRRSLGRDAIVSRGNEDIGLSRSVVECDAARFLTAAKTGDLQTATAAHGGDLLPGFFVSGTQEFDQWLEGVREMLRRTAADVFWSSAEEAKQLGQPVSAAACARRAAELASDSESATRRLMEFLESIDDHAGALDAYDGLARRLQTDFEATPSGKTRELAERIRRNGGGAVVQTQTPQLETAANRLRSLPWKEIQRRSKTLTGSAIIMVAFVSLWGLGRHAGSAAPTRTDASVAIDAPEVFDAAVRDAASTLIADASAALVAVPKLTVYAQPVAPGEEASNVHFLLRPNVSSHAGELRVTANLVDVETGTIVRSAAFRAAQDDTAALSALALDMAEFARKAMGRYLRATQIATSDADAEVLHQSMLARIRSDSLRDQGLADYALLTLDRADAMVEDALRARRSAALFVEKAEIARKKAWIYLLPPISDKNRANEASAAGVQFADAAIESKSQDAAAHEIRGLLAYDQWLTAPDRGAPEARDAAERFLRAAVDLNSSAPKALSALSHILIAKGDFANAYWAGERAYSLDTYMDVSGAVTAHLFTASLETGDLPAATRWCGDISRRSGDGWVSAYCKLQLVARTDRLTLQDAARGQDIVDRVSKSPTDAPFAPLLNSVLSVIYAKAGDSAHAAALLAGNDTGPLGDEAQPFRAWALLELGGNFQARSILEEYVRNNPSHRTGVLRSVRFASLR